MFLESEEPHNRRLFAFTSRWVVRDYRSTDPSAPPNYVAHCERKPVGLGVALVHHGKGVAQERATLNSFRMKFSYPWFQTSTNIAVTIITIVGTFAAPLTTGDIGFGGGRTSSVLVIHSLMKVCGEHRRPELASNFCETSLVSERFGT